MTVDKISCSFLGSRKHSPVVSSYDKEWEKEIDKIVEGDGKNVKPDKSNAKRNTIVGLSAAAILISLGVAARKGKLGPKIQKYVGGAQKTVEENMPKTKVEDIVPANVERTVSNANVEDILPKEAEVVSERIQKPLEPTYITKDGKIIVPLEQIKPGKFDKKIAKLKKGWQDEIKRINSMIDRNIPKIEDKFKTIKIYSKEECLDMIKREIDVSKIDLSKCWPNKDGSVCYKSIKGNYKYEIDINPADKSICSFRKSHLQDYDDSLAIVFGKGKKVDYTNRKTTEYFLTNAEGECITASRHVSPNQTVFYDGEGKISRLSINLCDESGKPIMKAGSDYRMMYSNDIHYRDGKICEIEYYDKLTGETLKTEFIKKNRVVAEEYVIPAGSINFKTSAVQYIIDKVNMVLKIS